MSSNPHIKVTGSVSVFVRISVTAGPICSPLQCRFLQILCLYIQTSSMSRFNKKNYIIQGVVEEQGTHNELMATRGLYYSLVMRQLTGNEDDDTNKVKLLLILQLSSYSEIILMPFLFYTKVLKFNDILCQNTLYCLF